MLSVSVNIVSFFSIVFSNSLFISANTDSYFTPFLVRYINAKMKTLVDTISDEKQKKYIEMLNNTITDCVIATTQTYVDTLKKQGKFDKEAQEQAFLMTFNAVSDLLTEESKKYLNEAIEDLDLYIKQKIESEVNINKTIVPD